MALVSPQRLWSLLHPGTVVLVGASDHSGFSRAAYHNLVEFGLADRVYLVNRRGARAHGRDTLTSCRQIAGMADMAFLMVPQAVTLAALADAAAAGISNIAVLASGFADAGKAGRRAQQELVAQAEALGVLLLGPNHLGFANLVDQVPVTPIPGLPRTAGQVAVVSQSGMGASAMTDFAVLTGVGLSHVVTLGNEAMITAGHVLDFLAGDPHTKAVALFCETVREVEVFRRAAARAARAGKAVVALKAGHSERSARAAAAHTGARMGDDRAVTALLHELGVITVDSIEDMVLTAGAAAHLGRLARPGIGVVSISGGACDMIADHASDVGAELPDLAPATCAALTAILPAYGTALNPLDITGAAIIDPSLFTRAIEIMSTDPAVGVIAVINSLPWHEEQRRWGGQVLADAIGAGAARARVPVVCVSQALQPLTAVTREVMTKAGLGCALPGLRQAVVALRNLAWWSQATRAAFHS
jgi:acetate---CoA ligase (ADP-forming)